MKKTILATAITALFAATTVQAATVYEKDGTIVDVYGDIEVYGGHGTEEGSGTFIELDDADIGMDIGYDIGHDLTAIATISFTGEGGSIDLDESFVGVSSADWGTLTMGQMVSIYDDAGIGSDYQFGWTSFYSNPDAGAQVVKYALDKDMFYGAVAWVKNTEADDSGANYIDGKVGARFDSLDVTLFFADGEVGTTDTSNINLEVRYQLDALELAAAYSVDEFGDDDRTGYGVAATYQLNDKVQFAGGVANIDVESADATIDGSQIDYFLNASYAFTSNVNTYIEIGGNDVDDSEFGYAAGMQVTF